MRQHVIQRTKGSALTIGGWNFSVFILPPSSFFLFLALLFTITGCGFHLRGAETLPFASLAVIGDSVTAAQLKQSVSKVSGTRLAPKIGEADAGLYVISESRDKIISALSAAGKVREYELRLRVFFRLTDKKGEEIIPSSEIMLFRLLPYDDQQILSKGEEEAMLYRDMQDDIVAQIMRRVAAAKPKA